MSGTGGYALLVEDDPDVAALLRHHLDRLAYDVEQVSSAEAALDRIGERSPDLAVVDIVLPGVDGRAVLCALQGSPQHAGCRIVVTSIVDRDDLEVEVDAVLARPFRRQDVARALGRAEGEEGPEGVDS